MLGGASKPFEARMESGPDGRAVWTYKGLDDTNADRAATLFLARMSVWEVAEELGISRSQAGRLRQWWSAECSGEVSQRPAL